LDLYAFAMNRLLAALLAASALSLTCADVAWAQSTAPSAWKWKDASGRINVSDTPPPSSVPSKDIIERPAAPVRAPAPAPAAASAPTAANSPPVNTSPRVDPELEARRQKAAADQQAQKREQEERNAAARAENCTRAKGHLASLSEGQRIARPNEKGEREVLDDKGRAEEMQRARSVIASDCK
jgi:type IV secretory pathway VirB10-like protein